MMRLPPLPNTPNMTNNAPQECAPSRSSPAIIQAPIILKTPPVPQPPTPAVGRSPHRKPNTPTNPATTSSPPPSMTVGPSMFQWVRGAHSNANTQSRPTPPTLRAVTQGVSVSRIKPIISDISILSRGRPRRPHGPSKSPQAVQGCRLIPTRELYPPKYFNP
ncbi:hypothetical protein L207DRAFT_121865 [Hyaloscypha variabilis F]|uniref:Uncharacterized protein n=1 Tax=Hyaloscypha variabilis (strain UAMH 11265 / GT02V1 / F) TaxID=1149755 RepID=A0A2J6R7T2_HYAVF|nr:hypothetical protein L207DRAFT_121865 [Hyaloscypha variabilis F]